MLLPLLVEAHGRTCAQMCQAHWKEGGGGGGVGAGAGGNGEGHIESEG